MLSNAPLTLTSPDRAPLKAAHTHGDVCRKDELCLTLRDIVFQGVERPNSVVLPRVERKVLLPYSSLEMSLGQRWFRMWVSRRALDGTTYITVGLGHPHASFNRCMVVPGGSAAAKATSNCGFHQHRGIHDGVRFLLAATLVRRNSRPTVLRAMRAVCA